MSRTHKDKAAADAAALWLQSGEYRFRGGQGGLELLLPVVRAGKKGGVPTPSHEFLVGLIHAMEGRPKA